MRILFSAVSAHGHVLPMMPMARAAMAAGLEVSVLTHGALSEVADPVPVLPAGPSFKELEAAFSAGAPGPRAGLRTLEGVGEFFVSTRVAATLDSRRSPPRWPAVTVFDRLVSGAPPVGWCPVRYRQDPGGMSKSGLAPGSTLLRHFTLLPCRERPCSIGAPCSGGACGRTAR